MRENHYIRLAVMTGLSFIAMYILMYAMVDRAGHVYNSINQVYMAILMAAPMALIEIGVMHEMYKKRNFNITVMALSVIVGIGAFTLIRFQSSVGDTQFVRSMIPHHSGAILMCREAPLKDRELKDLCSEIIRGQQKEIDQMTAILARLDR